MSYERSQLQKNVDYLGSKAFEGEVDAVLPPHISRTGSTDHLDFFIPHFVLEVKEKKQPLTERWHLLPGVDEENLFVLDELSFRKALKHYPYCYFLLRDVPGNRLFLADIASLACCERARRNRGVKGKFVVDLRNFRRVENLENIAAIIGLDIGDLAWKKSECLSVLAIGQV